jgi:hypothetical protein
MTCKDRHNGICYIITMSSITTSQSISTGDSVLLSINVFRYKTDLQLVSSENCAAHREEGVVGLELAGYDFNIEVSIVISAKLCQPTIVL